MSTQNLNSIIWEAVFNILESAGLPVLNGGWKFFGFLPEREWGRGQCHPGRSNIRRAKGFCHSVSSRCTRRSKRLQCPIEPQCPSRFSVLCTMGGTRTNMRWKKQKSNLVIEDGKYQMGMVPFFSLPAVMELGWAESTWCRFFTKTIDLDKHFFVQILLLIYVLADEIKANIEKIMRWINLLSVKISFLFVVL